MEMVTLKTFDQYFSANILRSRLESEGILCLLKDENTVTIDPLLSNAIGGIKLQVPEADWLRARSLLASYDDEARKSLTCPKCKSHHINLVNKQSPKNILTALLTWSFASYALAPEQIYQCQVCGFESLDAPETPAYE
ncbi:MAG: DUF2007 domain-containing protein [Sphingobacteriales bacterium]|nr:DUF2007 domain-containing protein [Sphingobacteriales bacterium]